MDLYTSAHRLSQRFRPAAGPNALGDHALIGDGASCALIGVDGSIAWLCMPRFDSPSVFAAILDPKRGGTCRVSPAGQDYESLKAYDESNNGNSGSEPDAFVTRVSAAGDALVWSTFFGGELQVSANGLALDAGGAAVFAGTTETEDLDTTVGSLQPDYGGGASDGFVARLDADGATLGWATYLGGSDADGLNAVALTSGSQPTVAGWTRSADVPLTARAGEIPGRTPAGVVRAEVGSAGPAPTPGAGGQATPLDSFPELDGDQDAYLARLSVGGGQLVHGTLYGGGASEEAQGLALDGLGAAALAGSTDSDDLPVSANAPQPMTGGAGDAFVAVLDCPPFALLSGSAPGAAPRAPRLSATGSLEPGSLLRIRLEDATAGAAACLLVGRPGVPTPFRGGLLVVDPVQLVLPAMTGPAGGFEVVVPVRPWAAPARLRFALQAWIVDPGRPANLAASNGLLVTTP